MYCTVNENKQFVVDGPIPYRSGQFIFIFHEIYKASLWRVSQILYEITTSVRFC